MDAFSSSIFKCRRGRAKNERKPQLTPHSLDFHFSTPDFTNFLQHNGNGSNLSDFYLHAIVELIENITHIVRNTRPMVSSFPGKNWRITSNLISEFQWSEWKTLKKTGKWVKRTLTSCQLLSRSFPLGFSATVGMENQRKWSFSLFCQFVQTKVDLSDAQEIRNQILGIKWLGLCIEP